MSVHGEWCGAKTIPGRCPVCKASIFYFTCNCGSKVYFDSLGDDWQKHSCFIDYDEEYVPRPLKPIEKPFVFFKATKLNEQQTKRNKKQTKTSKRKKKKNIKAYIKNRKYGQLIFSWQDDDIIRSTSEKRFVEGVIKRTWYASMTDLGLASEYYSKNEIKTYSNDTNSRLYEVVEVYGSHLKYVFKNSIRIDIRIKDKVEFTAQKKQTTEGTVIWTITKLKLFKPNQQDS